MPDFRSTAMEQRGNRATTGTVSMAFHNDFWKCSSFGNTSLTSSKEGQPPERKSTGSGLDPVVR